jgi:hypothetical protein
MGACKARSKGLVREIYDCSRFSSGRTAEDEGRCNARSKEGLVTEIYDFPRFSMCDWAVVTQGENGFGE